MLRLFWRRFFLFPLCRLCLIASVLAGWPGVAVACIPNAPEEDPYGCIVRQMLNLIGEVSPQIHAVSFRVIDDTQFRVRIGLSDGNGQPQIGVSKGFLDTFRRTERGKLSYWGMMFWVAHEIGHAQLNHHRLVRPCPGIPAMSFAYCPGVSDDYIDFNHRREHEADAFAAHTLIRLGATLDDTQGALRYCVEELGGGWSDLHPAYDKRLENVTRVAKLALESSPGFMADTSLDLQSEASPFVIYVNRDVRGYELFSMPMLSEGRCAATCLRHSSKRSRLSCDAFSFDTWTKFCYLKHFAMFSPSDRRTGGNFASAMIPSANSVVGILSSLVSKRPNALRVGPYTKGKLCSELATAAQSMFFDVPRVEYPPMSGTQREAWGDCRKRCGADDECMAFQVEPVGSQFKCSVFASVRGKHLAPGSGSTLGYRHYDWKPVCPPGGPTLFKTEVQTIQ